MKRAAFYNTVRQGFGSLSQSQVDGFEAVLDAIDGAPLAHQAYMLATAFHETGAMMQPIKEKGGHSYFTRLYDVAGDRPKLCISMGNTCAGDGPRFCGRGYTQTTWKTNYERLDAESAKAGLTAPGDILANPDLAMRPDIAALGLREGMEQGWYTGKSLSSYLPAHGVATRAQYIAARRIINGTDKSELIAGYARVFERALRDGGVA